ncbi:MAG: RNA 2',3'-cyclic phosphodiesterase [Nitrospirota bacterium]
MGIRCFICIEFPESVKQSIGDVIDILRKSGADIRWVSPENIHLTLKFLGQTDESLITPIKDSLHKKVLPYGSFYIKISGVGYFPDSKRPRVIWAGVEESELLKKLSRDIEEEMLKFGYENEKKAFSPHLTIGRVRSQKRIAEVLKRLDEFSKSDFGNIEINNIILMKSELKPAGAQYYRLAEIPFGRRNDVEQG